jgi:hypothetical protein
MCENGEQVKEENRNICKQAGEKYIQKGLTGNISYWLVHCYKGREEVPPYI